MQRPLPPCAFPSARSAHDCPEPTGTSGRSLATAKILCKIRFPHWKGWAMTLLEQPPPVRAMPAARHYAARRQLESVVSGTTRMSSRVSRRLAVSVGIGLAIAGGTAAGAAELLPSKGPLPASSNGQVPWSKVPDFIAVTSGGRVVGYAPRSDLIAPPQPQKTPPGFGAVPIPVYAANLHTLVGHMYPGVGFLRLGASPTSVPCQTITVIENGTTNTVACPSVQVTLPDVVGMSTPTAVGKLSSLGLNVAVVNMAASTSGQLGTISNMMPRAGSVVHARSTVTIDNRTPG